MKKVTVSNYKVSGHAVKSMPIYLPMDVNIKVQRIDNNVDAMNRLYDNIKPGDKLKLDITLKSFDRNGWVLTESGKKIGSFYFERNYHYFEETQKNTAYKYQLLSALLVAMSMIQDKLVITVTDVLHVSQRPANYKYSELNGVLDVVDPSGTKEDNYSVEDAGDVERDPY